MIACAVLPLAVITVRTYRDAAIELRVAETLPESARVEALGRAARHYLPWGPSSEARAQLAELGRANVPVAYATLRAAILASRCITTPDARRLAEANGAIAETRGATYASPAPEPSRLFSLLALVGLALFLVAAARTVGATSLRAARAPLARATAGLALLLFGLWRA